LGNSGNMNKSDSYYELTEGYQYPSVTFSFADRDVSVYLNATADTCLAYDDKSVPPLAVAARAIAVLSAGMVPPPGTTHAAQSLEFLHPVKIGDFLTLDSRVEKRLDRGPLHTWTTGFTIVNEDREEVMTGKITVACQSSEAKWLRLRSEL
jgi:hypothetical protein